MDSLNTSRTLNTIFAAWLLTALSSAALAQTNFQLPRECLERQVANPERCVIQDGPPRLPLVPQARSPVGGAGGVASPTTSQPGAAPATKPSQPSSSAPFAARR